ncbi:MAG: hypothetical protein U0264_05395 [Candidatus Kapaibacterium sp.]
MKKLILFDPDIEEILLQQGDEDTASQIVQKIIEIVLRDSTHELVIETAKTLTDRTGIRLVEAVFDYVLMTYPYKSIYHNNQYFVAPVHLLSKKITHITDGVTLTSLLASLLIALKCSVRIELIAWDQAREYEFTHIFLSCSLPNYNQPIYLDIVNELLDVFPDPPTPIVKHKSFKIN